MSFISYAQNYEDVILWRALKHVKNGFYIDVGANDPNVDSVTKAFYDRGWRGINIEPIESHYLDLVQARPGDINLSCAAGFEPGIIDLWEFDVIGWATASTDVIKKHEKDRHVGLRNRVSMLPLGDICEQHVKGDIHFLKIDVEGFEKNVLKGMNLKKFRPWIVVIEATKPNSTEEIHKDWETLIVSNDYFFAYADGLNRFYVSKERAPHLLDSLRYPPNVFDGFIRAQQLSSEIRAQDSEAKAQQAQERAHQAEVKAQQAQERAHQAEVKAQQAQEQAHQAEAKAQQAQERAHQAEVKAQQAQEQAHQAEVKAQQAQGLSSALLKSNSWRITAPLRWLVQQLTLLHNHGFKQRTKAAVKKVLHKVVPLIVARPKLMSIAAKVAYKLGMAKILKSCISMFASYQQPTNQYSPQQTSAYLMATLNPRARQIYQDLKLAVESKQKVKG